MDSKTDSTNSSPASNSSPTSAATNFYTLMLLMSSHLGLCSDNSVSSYSSVEKLPRAGKSNGQQLKNYAIDRKIKGANRVDRKNRVFHQ